MNVERIQQAMQGAWDACNQFTLRLPYPISANRYWTSRAAKSKKTGKMIVLTHPSSEAQAYKQQVGWMAAASGIRKPIQGRVAVEINLFPHRPEDWAKRARKDPDGWADTVQCIDLGNCEKVLSDALNGVAWNDDKQLHEIVMRRHDPDEHGARVEVTIRPIVNPKIAPELPLCGG